MLHTNFPQFFAVPQIFPLSLYYPPPLSLVFFSVSLLPVTRSIFHYHCSLAFYLLNFHYNDRLIVDVCLLVFAHTRTQRKQVCSKPILFPYRFIDICQRPSTLQNELVNSKKRIFAWFDLHFFVPYKLLSCLWITGSYGTIYALRISANILLSAYSCCRSTDNNWPYIASLLAI